MLHVDCCDSGLALFLSDSFTTCHNLSMEVMISGISQLTQILNFVLAWFGLKLNNIAKLLQRASERHRYITIQGI